MLDHSGKPLALPSTSAQNLTPSRHLLCSHLASSHHPQSPGPSQPHPTLSSLGLQTPLIQQPGDVMIRPLPTGLSFPSQGKCPTIRTASKTDALWSLQSTDVLSVHAGRSPPRPSQAGFSTALAHTDCLPRVFALGSPRPGKPFPHVPTGHVASFPSKLSSEVTSSEEPLMKYHLQNHPPHLWCSLPCFIFLHHSHDRLSHYKYVNFELLVFSHWKGMPMRAGDVSVW